ncbi:MAG: 6,7-dimethyl-8-ribityllumazine synthase [Candidatus Peregrinibacteria bacterium GW2011_GWA2_47_7]|nr:MAG: 6,7-dimethyl-8-ribityllumazine synthase [Candidatus Peregrinibacteria bacterium GW2011_GWA2_47_7]
MPIAFIVSSFNKEVSDRLLSGALRACALKKIPKKNIEIYWVPGAFEIPVKAAQLLSKKKYQGIITLGCLIKGETDHYEYICQGLTFGLQKVAIDYKTPVLFGVLTCRDYRHARNRSKNDTANKGYAVTKSFFGSCVFSFEQN